MNKELLRKLMTEATYQLKEGTSSTFLDNRFTDLEMIASRKEKTEAIRMRTDALARLGDQIILPIKLGYITTEESAKVADTGRGKKARSGQIKAQYSSAEQSPYKIAKPFKLSTSIWQIEGYKCFYYGTIGITQQEDKPAKDNGDLIVFYTADWQAVKVFVFKGLASPNGIADLGQIVEYLKNDVLL